MKKIEKNRKKYLKNRINQKTRANAIKIAKFKKQKKLIKI